MDAPNGKLNSLSQANINVLQATNKVFAALLTTNAVSYCLLRKTENYFCILSPVKQCIYNIIATVTI